MDDVRRELDEAGERRGGMPGGGGWRGDGRDRIAPATGQLPVVRF